MSRQIVYERTLHAGVETISGDGGAGEGFPVREAVFVLDVSASGGSAPTLDVTIEELDAASGNWIVIDTFAQKVTTGQERRTFASIFGSTLRAAWVIGGSGGETFTFTVGAEGKAL
jgi:hypothetical protein